MEGSKAGQVLESCIYVASGCQENNNEART